MSRRLFKYMDAAKKGDVKTLERLLFGGKIDPNECDIFFKRTALHWAVVCGHIPAIRLLGQFCNTEIRDIWGRNVMMTAANAIKLEYVDEITLQEAQPYTHEQVILELVLEIHKQQQIRKHLNISNLGIGTLSGSISARQVDIKPINSSRARYDDDDDGSCKSE